MPAGTSFLGSDVVTINGTNTSDVFVVDMSFNPAAYGTTSADSAYFTSLFDRGYLYLGELENNQWVNAGVANGGTQGGGILGAWNNSLTPGTWGVDPTNDTAWAVVENTSGGAMTFAVVPEPGTLALLAAAAGCGWLMIRRRRK